MKNNNDRPLTFGEFTLFVKDFEEFRQDMLDFKQDMLGFKRDMLGFKEDMLRFKAETLSFKQDYLSFKKEMLEFKRQTQNNFDMVFKMLTDMQTEMKAFYSLYQRHDEKLANHEQRLLNLGG
jgi:hypothetical protein